MLSYQKPNVLIIYTDQQRLDSLGCYSKYPLTPNLDKLAADGARFDKFFVNNPVCMPSRMSMLTGRYPSSLGIGANGIPFPEDAVPVNQILKPYGYHTAQIGKLHFDPHSNREHKNPTKTYGFDTFILSDEPGCYDDAYTKWVESIDSSQLPGIRAGYPPAAMLNSFEKPAYADKPRNTHEPYVFESDDEFTHTAFVASETCEFLKRHKHDRFFAIAGFYAPHCPINPPRKYVDMYRVDEMPDPVIGKEDQVMPILRDIPGDKWKEIIACYLALVTHVDAYIGRIIDTLKKEGLYENTLIVFTSDHGEYLGDHGRIQKSHHFDCILNVPCIMTWPKKIPPGSVIKEMAEAVDIVPTILDFCGIQTPLYVQGRSLAGLLRGNTRTHKDSIISQFFETNGAGSTVLRTQEYKYVIDHNGDEILYDLVNDPDELKSIAKQEKFSETLSFMRKRLLERLLHAQYFNINRTAPY